MMRRVEDVGFKGYPKGGIETWTADALFTALPHNYRHGIKTPIVLVNNIEDVQRKRQTCIFDCDGYDVQRECWTKGLLVRKIGSLDFYNEISGFLHTNTAAGHKLYDACSGIQCVPEDIEVTTIPPYHTNYNRFPSCAGMILIDHNFDVYICKGWVYDEYNGDGSSEVYLDWA